MTEALGIERFVEALRASRSVEGVCPFCGWTEEQWRLELLLGCPLCYTVFEHLIATNPPAQPS